MSRVLRSSRLMMAGLVLIATGALIATSSGASTSRVAARTPYPACAAAGTVNWLDTAGSGAAGSVYYSLKFTNLSGHTCQFYGYPGVSAVNLAGGQIGASASHSGGTVQTKVLVQGATVSAQLRIVNVGNFSPSACHATTAAGLRVYAPNQTSSRIIPYPLRACALSGLGYLSVGPITTP